MMSTSYKRYALGLITAVYTLNLVDRGLMGLLLQPIKDDLQLTDTQLGLLTGIIFALFYATMGLPIARVADRGNRVTIAAASIGFWGLILMCYVFIGNFVQLAIGRMMAAIGEAGCKPPTYSLVGDYFPEPAERTRAMSIYWLGSPLAMLISFVVGGWLNELVGWRLTFLIMGIPGLILAVLLKLTLAEPRAVPMRSEDNPRLPPMMEVLRTLWLRRSTRHLCIGLILTYTLSFGLSPWYASFLHRSHGLSTSEAGLGLGLIFSIGGVAGLLLGGFVSNRFFAGNEPGQLRLSAWTIAAVVPCFIGFLLLPDVRLSLAALAPLSIAFIFFMGPTFATIQRLLPDNMRATVLSVVMLLANLIGMGLGPQLVGLLSDALRPSYGEDSLRYAMIVLSGVGLLAAYHFVKASRTVADDLAAEPPVASRPIVQTAGASNV